MRRYRVREGSIADYGRMFIVGALLWGSIFGLAVLSYGM